MLAKDHPSFPHAQAMAGGTRWEPKWDGWRVLIARDGDTTTLWTRAGKPITGMFPEIVEAVDLHVPAGVVLDGELVVWNDSHLDFTALTRRANVAQARAHVESLKMPASYAAFDVLATGGLDLRGEQFDKRRAVLESIAEDWHPPLHLSPVTDEPAIAQSWFRDMGKSGIEGLVAKGGAQRYRPGVRGWLKFKERQTLDVVAAAVLGPLDSPRGVVIGLPIDGTLQIVGTTTPPHMAAMKTLRPLLAAPRGLHPWPREVRRSTFFGFSGADHVTLNRIEPVVVEVSADRARVANTFRHPVRLIRARPDRTIESVALPPWFSP